MPLYVGNKKISEIYYGNKKIAQVYKGNQLVYQSVKRLRLYAFKDSQYNDDVYGYVYLIGTYSKNYPVLGFPDGYETIKSITGNLGVSGSSIVSKGGNLTYDYYKTYTVGSITYYIYKGRSGMLDGVMAVLEGSIVGSTTFFGLGYMEPSDITYLDADTLKGDLGHISFNGTRQSAKDKFWTLDGITSV